MARYNGPACRLCRRENAKLFLKGDRCISDKCAFDRRKHAPGQHGMIRKKLSEYGEQLREKQKVKRIYGLVEGQFRLTFQRAERKKGVTGDNLLQLLELRLDNVIFRMGFANSRRAARMFVTHRHFLVNGHIVNIPSYVLKEGDSIKLKEQSQKVKLFQEMLLQLERKGIPKWLEIDKDHFTGVVKNLPLRADVEMEINEQLIVELYSK